LAKTKTLCVALAVFSLLSLNINEAQGACPIAKLEVQVETARGDIDELFDVTLAELARTAEELNLPLRHPILGVYGGSIGMTFEIDDEVVAVAGSRLCVTPKVVHVRILLTGRAVHLLREFVNNPCLLELARGHQQKHAQADDASLDRFVRSLPGDLRARWSATVLEPAASEAAARQRMAEAATGILNEQLDSYEDGRVKLNDVVDTTEEVGRLRKACGREGPDEP
jgi:hypothetical protein